MSVQDQQKQLENLNKEIEEKEKTLNGLKVDITSRHKLLETLNNIDKSSDSQALVRTIKRQEEELNNRDEQIKSLYERLEESQKTLKRKDSEKNQAGSVEELQKAWEAQKVKYVEEIQRMSIELKKKDRLMEEKCKAYDDTIAEMTTNIHNLEAKILEQSKQITQIEEKNKHSDEEVELLKEKNDSLDKELQILGDSNKKLREAYDKNEEELKLIREENKKTEEAISSKNELDAKEMKDKDEEVHDLKKENKALSLELANCKKNIETLINTQNEKETKMTKLNEDLTHAEEKLRTVTQDLEKEKKAHQAQADLLQELVNSENEKNNKAEDAVKQEQDKFKDLQSKAYKADELEKENETLRKTGMTFEQKLEAVRLENEAEMRKLCGLLQTAEADKSEKVAALEEKEMRLQELEEINTTFEGLVQGLKKTILDVQERLEKNGRYLLDLQRKLKAKETELEVFKTAADTKIQSVAKAKDDEYKHLVSERAEQEEKIAKLEKSLLQMMDEATMYKQKFKVTSDRLAAMSRKNSHANSNQLAQKDTEINILKEMLKASQGVIRTKDLELTKIKQRGSPIKLPKINGGYEFTATKEGPRYGNSNPHSGLPTLHGNYSKAVYDQRSVHESESNFSVHDMKNKYGHDALLEKLMETMETPTKKSMENYMSEIHQRIEREALKYRHDRGSSTEREQYQEDLARTQEKSKTKRNNGNIFDPSADAEHDNFKNMGVSPVKVTKKKPVPPTEKQPEKKVIKQQEEDDNEDEEEDKPKKTDKKVEKNDKKKQVQQPKQAKKDEDDDEDEEDAEEEEQEEEQEDEEDAEEEQEELTEREEIEA